MELIPLIALVVLVLAVAGLLLLNWRTARTKLRRLKARHKGPRDVQCPACSRWQLRAPQESTYEDAARLAAEGQLRDQEVIYVNDYHCAFCGHRWREDYFV